MRKIPIAANLPLLMLSNNNDHADQICLLISKHDKVKYYTAEGEKKKVRGGALLSMDGKLKVGPNASVVLFSNGRYVRVDEAGEHALEELFPENKLQKLNFDTRFNRYLMTAIDLVAGAEQGDAWQGLKDAKGSGDGWSRLGDPKGGADGWGGIGTPKPGADGWGGLSGTKPGADGWGGLSGAKPGADGWGGLSGTKTGADGWGNEETTTARGLGDAKGPADGWGLGDPKGGASGWGLGDAKGGADGWGDQDGRIVPILPFGKIPKDSIIFQWSQPRISQSFHLEIQSEEGQVVFETDVQDNWAMVDLKTVSLEMETPYAWQIVVPDQPEQTSTKAGIMVTEEKSAELIDAKLKKSDAYQLRDVVLGGLMEAVVLEEADHYYEANQRYEQLRQSFKKNYLVKLMQAAFYLRYQLKPRAQQLFVKA